MTAQQRESSVLPKVSLPALGKPLESAITSVLPCGQAFLYHPHPRAPREQVPLALPNTPNTLGDNKNPTTKPVVLPKHELQQVQYSQSCFNPDLLHFCSSELAVQWEPRVRFWSVPISWPLGRASFARAGASQHFLASIPCTEMAFLTGGYVLSKPYISWYNCCS